MDSDKILSNIQTIFSSNPTTKTMLIEFNAENQCYHIYNRNDYIYYDIYVKIKSNNHDEIHLKIDRNIVRHDDSVVLRNVIDIDTHFDDIYQYIKQIN